MELRELLETKGFMRVPLKKLATGHYTLSVRINSKKGVFILDTGASTSCIGNTATSYFFLKTEESEIKASGAGATGMETSLAKDVTTQVMEKETLTDFVIFDLSHVNSALAEVNEISVHGILGADYLKKSRAVIDYGRNCFYIK